jgi:glycosidase
VFIGDDNMSLDFTIYHEAKSKYAYIYDKETIHLRVIATKNKIDSIKVIYGDPFHWGPKEHSDEWEWKVDEKDNITLRKEYETTQFDHFFIAIKPKTLRVKYAFVVNEQYLFGTREIIDLIKSPELKYHHFNYFNYPYLNEEDIFDAPNWVQNQTWYSIFPERFFNGDSSINLPNTKPWGSIDNVSNEDRFGGDLQGIIDKLDYIKDSGFTGIYMTPIFESDTAHKYDVNNYFKIDKAFGSNETFKELVNQAHDRGLKVMLDAVFNHCGFRHPYFQDVIKNGKQSKYYDCFHIINHSLPVINFDVDNSGKIIKSSLKELRNNHTLLNYRTFAFTPYMPKLNTNHPIMRQHLLDVSTFWINEYDIDGWRLDVSNEVSHSFWRDFRKQVKAAKKDAYIVGENWDNSNPWLKGDQYDGVMNYELLFPIWNYFGTNIDHMQYTSTEFMYRINQVLTDYPKNVLPSLYNLVDSHDTTRILEICNNRIELVKLPYLFLFTFPGAPSIYYGGEIGLSGKHDPLNRKCMIWDQDKQNLSLQTFIKKIIQLRNTYRAFKSVDYNWIETNDSEEYIIFQKEDIYFIISKRYKENIITLPEIMTNKTYINLYNDSLLHVEDTIDIGSYGFYILRKK